MRDYTICFWDYREMFKFESNINYNLEEIQTKIWFLDNCNHWFTTDKLNNLFAWHLENVQPRQLKRVHTKPVTCIAEIYHSKTFITCSLDQTLVIWDIIRFGEIKRVIDL